MGLFDPCRRLHPLQRRRSNLPRSAYRLARTAQNAKLALPLALDEAQSTASIPYGHIRRVDDGGEEPCQDWVDLSGVCGGQRFGLTLLNDSKYGYDALGSTLRMSLLRSPVFAFHTPRQIEQGVTYHYTDQGEQHARLALVPYAGN